MAIYGKRHPSWLKNYLVMMVLKGYTVETIAKRLKCHPVTVRRNMSLFGIRSSTASFKKHLRSQVEQHGLEKVAAQYGIKPETLEVLITKNTRKQQPTSD